VTTPQLIEAALVPLFAAVEGIKKVYDHEPGEIPRQSLPAVTLYWRGETGVDVETGPCEDVTHAWSVYVYFDTADQVRTQQRYKEILPALFTPLRVDPTIGDLVDRATLTDPALQEPQPIWNAEGRLLYLRKQLLLHAVVTES
jgi:hypothetical protein